MCDEKLQIFCTSVVVFLLLLFFLVGGGGGGGGICVQCINV